MWRIAKEAIDNLLNTKISYKIYIRFLPNKQKEEEKRNQTNFNHTPGPYRMYPHVTRASLWRKEHWGFR